MTDHVIHRVLGAIRFIDAAAALVGSSRGLTVVTEALQVAAGGLTFRRNRRGYYVIHRSTHPQLRLHHEAFPAPPAAPPVGSIPHTLTVQPLTRTYLPRRADFTLPRDPDPDADNSLFSPIDVGLYLAPTASPFPGWGTLRVTIRNGDGAAVPGALVRVVESADTDNLMGRGMSDWRGRASGQALVAVTDIPALGVASNGDGPLLTRTIAIQVQAFHDPAFNPQTDLPDPDDLEERRGTLAASSVANLEIAAGQVQTLVLTMS